MNIAFFTDSYKPNVDGVARSLELLKQGLEELGHNVYIIMPSPNGKEIIDNDIYMLKSFDFLPYPDYKVGIPNLKKLTAFIEKKDIDILHNHGVGFTALACIEMSHRFNLKSITTFHTSVADALHYLTNSNIIKEKLYSLTWSYLRWLYSKFDVVTSPTKYAAKKLLENANIKAEIIENPVDKKFNVKRNPTKRIELLHVGRVAKEKNLEFILPFLAKHREIYLDVVGKGPHLEFYKALYKNLNNVKFLGYVDDDVLATLYGTKTALVFCSEFDTQGLVVAEALYAGMPVIAKKNTAAEELTPYVFWDEESFLHSVKKAKENEICDECKKKAKRFEIKNVLKKLMKVYKS